MPHGPSSSHAPSFCEACWGTAGGSRCSITLPPASRQEMKDLILSVMMHLPWGHMITADNLHVHLVQN